MKAIDAVHFQEFINIYKTKQEEQANKGWGLEYFGPKEMQMLLDKLPTIEAEPVVHGKWIERKSIHADGGVVAKCSICEKDVQYLGQRLKFCPNCGAKMDLKE